MKNACIVGLGAIGPIHADAAEKATHAKVYAVCDTDKSRAEKYAKQYNAKAVYDFNDILSDKNIDVVHICTPHYLHKDMAVRALKAGKHIVLEKPATMTAEELEELKKAYKASDKKACIVLQNRTNTSVAEMKRIADTDKSLGKLLGMTGFMTWHRDDAYYASAPWRGTWKYEGGGVLINQSMHMIDLIDWLGGGITELKADLSNKIVSSVEVEDTAEAIFKLNCGARAVFYATNAFSADMPFRIEMIFEKATLRYADNRLYKISDNTEVLANDIQIIGGKKCWGGGHRKVIDDFYSVLDTGVGDYIDLNDGFRSASVMLAMYKKGLNTEKDWIKI